MTQSNVEKPHEWLAQFDQNRQQLHIQFNQARQQFDQVRCQAFEIAQSTLKECQTQQTQFQTQKQNVEHNIQQWLSQHTDFNALLLQQLSEISHEQEQQLKQRVVDVERAHSDALASTAIQEQLLQHMEHQPEIDAETLSSQLTTVTEQLKQLIEQRDQVKLKIEMHQRNIEKQKQFADQIQAIQSEEHRWSKIRTDGRCKRQEIPRLCAAI